MMRKDRARLIYWRLQKRMWAICHAVQPIDPGPQYWLNSDCGSSYCVKCVNIARGAEFDLGCPVGSSQRFYHDDWERAFYDGIDGGHDIEGDSPAACEICGSTLSYILTDHGAENELQYYREAPLAALRGEDAYALDRLVLNIYDGSPRHVLLGAALVVNRAWRLIHPPAVVPA